MGMIGFKWLRYVKWYIIRIIVNATHTHHNICIIKGNGSVAAESVNDLRA